MGTIRMTTGVYSPPEGQPPHTAPKRENRAATHPRIDNILSVSEKIPASAGYVWKPTAPDPVRIHGRLFDEVVAVTNKELLYEELLKRNPRIRIVRKGES
ncbi:hypothetical protein [Gordonibacter massiliensis (ex Traore et al. 2017)]|uniref:hypothetical protein n=1 Tax=Gordonibacter massiliensis (ex Traore et al. 2017) TaxID=1841863 RepID=UPI001C8B85AD|nr:hypothetical protein [Gordonibacter massiliensis (ex Traore et al. 2017)]MBX9034908.1 hypothetical protein [Gordonibacter massiliensis (ex Traore et al. 2017)]